MGMSKIDKDWCVDEAQVIITGPIVRNIHGSKSSIVVKNVT